MIPMQVNRCSGAMLVCTAISAVLVKLEVGIFSTIDSNFKRVLRLGGGLHDGPDQAWSDGEQSLDFAEFDAMMAALQPWIELRAMASSEERLEQCEFALKCPGNGAI